MAKFFLEISNKIFKITKAVENVKIVATGSSIMQSLPTHGCRSAYFEEFISQCSNNKENCSCEHICSFCVMLLYNNQIHNLHSKPVIREHKWNCVY